MSTAQPVTYGRRLAQLAGERPHEAAIIFSTPDAESTLTWREFEERTNQIARLFASLGVAESSTVVVGLPNCTEHYLASFAAWKLGAAVLPLKPALPNRERDAILDLVNPALVVSAWDDSSYQCLAPVELTHAHGLANSQLPDVVANPGKLMGSGGSTGRPKIIVTPGPWLAAKDRTVEILKPWRFHVDGRQLVAAPLYHNAPFNLSVQGIACGNALIVMDRFDAERALDLVERHAVTWMYLPPILMQRIARVQGVQERDFSSIHGMMHTAAACPPWLKEQWIDLLGPERVTEMFGSTELVGITAINGVEWLQRPGSVGRPYLSELRIQDDDGNDLPAGTVGEIYMRRPGLTGPSYAYIGAPPAKTTPDGFTSVGDLGWVDEDGYLYLADRQVDLIISGGANIYSAEVEAALSEHLGVADVVVIGLPDEEWGKHVHAIIQPLDAANPPSEADLDQHCRERIAGYKRPKTYELMAELPRDNAGKIRRSALVAERSSESTSQQVVSSTSRA